MKNIGRCVCVSAVVVCTIGLIVWMMHISKDVGYKVNLDAKETPEEFPAFLDSCSLEERIALMQSLRGLKQKIGSNCYGKLSGLAERSRYVDDRDRATEKNPFLPKTYNEVSPTTVAGAIAKGHLSEDLVSVSSIKKEMVWRRYNKINYLFHEKGELDYHRDYVKWVAWKCKIDQMNCDSLSTFYLEQKVYKNILPTSGTSLVLNGV